jgi:hypothetical protein
MLFFGKNCQLCDILNFVEKLPLKHVSAVRRGVFVAKFLPWRAKLR